MMHRMVVLAILIFAGDVQADDRPWLDSGLTTEARVQALLDAMTVDDDDTGSFLTPVHFLHRFSIFFECSFIWINSPLSFSK